MGLDVICTDHLGWKVFFFSALLQLLSEVFIAWGMAGFPCLQNPVLGAGWHWSDATFCATSLPLNLGPPQCVQPP